MISATASSQSRHVPKWVGMTGFVLLVQLGLIFWFGEREKPVPPVLEPVTMLSLAPDQMAEVPGVGNPTMLVLANRRGFSDAAWMRIPAMDYEVPEWTEEPRLLRLPVEQLTKPFREYVEANCTKTFEVVGKPEPQFAGDQFIPLASIMETQSKLTVDGELADRPLKSPLELKSWPANDILSNSIVRVSVTPEGDVFSQALLSRCGSPEADAYALNLAKSARFQPLRNGTAKPSGPDAEQWGTLVFHWHTVAPPATNSLSAAP
jgi:hypothetical protein